MRFNTFATVAVISSTLSTFSLADRMTVHSKCPCANCGGREHKGGIFYTDYGAHNVNARNGYRKTGVPHMTEFCVDWPQLRAHFRFANQHDKRCMIVRERVPYGSSADHCWRTEFVEAPCHWRKAMPGNETESAVEPSETPHAEISARISSDAAEETSY